MTSINLTFHAFFRTERKTLCKYLSIDPLGRPTDPTDSDHYFRTDFRPSVCPHCSKYRETKQTSRENNDHYWWDCGSGQGDH